MKTRLIIGLTGLTLASGFAVAEHHGHKKNASDSTLAKHRASLAANTQEKGFGPQSPRDLGTLKGSNTRKFSPAPPHGHMNLCNIHFHKNAEHKGGEFTTFAGIGDGKGNNTGYKYSGKLSSAETAPTKVKACGGKGDPLSPGDTIEVHYVHTTAKINPGPTLGACLADSIMNPQLRVEAQVYVVVNNKDALDFNTLTKYGVKDGYHQALNIPSNTGSPITYAGSTTGPSYNEAGSPLQVTWSVRPNVAKVSIDSVAKWCEGNTFNEDHAHGVRNLVINPELISNID